MKEFLNGVWKLLNEKSSEAQNVRQKYSKNEWDHSE